MHLPILVAYSTRTGSTGEVAEVMAAELRRAGLTVELARMREMKSFGLYAAAVFGAPVYMGALPGETSRFLRRYRPQISALPAWFYVLGPIRGKPWEYREAGEQAQNRLRKFPWLQAKEVKVFGGRFDPNRMPFPYSLAMHLPAFPLKDDPSSDVRDWDDIRAWASMIADKFAPRHDRQGSTMTFTGASIG